eukprot:5187828-Karenia_brevis.AAC.1
MKDVQKILRLRRLPVATPVSVEVHQQCKPIKRTLMNTAGMRAMAVMMTKKKIPGPKSDNYLPGPKSDKWWCEAIKH